MQKDKKDIILRAFDTTMQEGQQKRVKIRSATVLRNNCNSPTKRH